MTQTAQVAKPSFGFGELDDIQPRGAETERVGSGRSLAERPRAAERPPITVAESAAVPALGPAPSRAADDAAARLGFGSREPLVRRRKRQPIEEPVEQINLRAAVADINVFIEWCEKQRYSYREGFAELVKHIDAEAA